MYFFFSSSFFCGSLPQAMDYTVLAGSTVWFHTVQRFLPEESLTEYTSRGMQSKEEEGVGGKNSTSVMS